MPKNCSKHLNWKLKIPYITDWLVYAFASAMTTVPFLFPQYAAELNFFAYVPLWYVIKLRKPSFSSGVWYGVSFYMFFGCGLLQLLHEHGYGMLKYVAMGGYVLYGAFLSGVWFLGLQFVTDRVQHMHYLVYGLSVAIVTCAYWYYIDSFFWLPCGVIEGNTLQNVLVPLAVRHQWLYLLNYLPMYVIWLMLLMINFLWIEIGKKESRVVLVFLLLIIGCGWISKRGGMLPLKISYGQAQSHNSAWDAADAIATNIQAITNENQATEMIIFPESAFPFPLNLYPEHMQDWADLLPATCSLIIGAHRYDNGKLFNTVYHIQRRIMHHYDKCFRMFLTEYVPSLFIKTPMIKDLFLHNKELFIQGSNKGIFSIKGKRVVPAICSEWYFNAHRLSIPEEAIVLVVANDSWFSCGYVRELMQLTARLQAIKTGHPLIYCSHEYGFSFYPGWL